MDKDLTKRILAGDVRAAARLMRGIEDDLPDAAEELQKLYPHTGKAMIIGITGAPGVGKSTLVDALITAFRSRGKTVGVVAIDPTSPFTGGALLGDRVRMGKHAVDRGVFIRSLASRGWAGGLSRAAGSIMHVLDAMGKDVVLVEAVGAGQGEVDIARVVDTTLVVLSPGMGDEIQMMKAGMLETADIYVVNKADRPGADGLRVQLEQMCAMGAPPADGWSACIVLTQAANGVGIDELAEAILRHREYLVSTGAIRKRRLQRARLELTEAIEHALREQVRSTLDEAALGILANDLVDKRTDPLAAAARVVVGIIRPPVLRAGHRASTKESS